MPKSPFMPSEFTPTEWSTAAEKADFGNSLLRFIEAGWKPTMFTKKLYERLSMCFENIAHYVERAVMRSDNTNYSFGTAFGV